MREPGIEILVSFCNVRLPGRPALALVNPRTGDVRIPRLPSDLPARLSITGLAVSERFLYAGLPGPPTERSVLIVLDRRDLTLAGSYEFRSVVDVHSLWWSDERLYVVSTGTDEVVELRLDGPEVRSETVMWRPERDAPRADVHHLNAIYGWRGALLVSGFGKKTGEVWSLTRDGFVCDVTSGERVVSGIAQPHSLVAVGDTIACCESATMAVRVLGRDQGLHQLPGYARGLCVIAGELCAGTSVGRRVSKSTGAVNSPNATGAPVGRCSVSRLSVERLQIEETLDLSDYGDEIYDLLPVEGTAGWSEVANGRFMSAEDTGQVLLERIQRDIATLVSGDEAFILVDEEVLRHKIALASKTMPFLERDGQYWGRPADDAMAIRELERLRISGARLIAFAWPTFWWLDYYAGLHRYLRENFRCVLQNDILCAFDLRGTVPTFSRVGARTEEGGAPAPWSDGSLAHENAPGGG